MADKNTGRGLEKPHAPTVIGSKPCLLVVEGKDDEGFFEALVKHLGLHESIQLHKAQGKDNLRDALDAVVKNPGFPDVNSLGLVRDADQNPKAAFQSICSILPLVGLPVPKTVLAPIGQNPRVTIMILPSLDRPGALEDICIESVAEDACMSCVEGYLECLSTKGIKIRDNMRAKAMVQVFLASRPRPGLQLAVAAQAKIWPWDHEVFVPLQNFLRLVV